MFDAEPAAECIGVGAITCFLVAPDRRRRGIARALLDAALAGFAEDGLAIAEAYPRHAADGPAANHHGPMG
ncbi:GNAT family N-acetyltransferase, partial [Mycobacterium tuberculosis]|nr:GNAT family N-acetyltransferase [Mycobacterium tuberculosis]